MFPAHTPQWNDMRAQSENNGPVRPHSQMTSRMSDREVRGLNPHRGLWHVLVQSKRPFKIPIFGSTSVRPTN